MTILLLANHLDAGGIASYVATLAREFVRRGDRVIVASAGGSLVPSLDPAGVKHVPFSFRVKSGIHPCIFLQIPALVRLVQKERVQIIHAQTRVTQTAAALVSRLTGVPYVSTCHGFFRPHWGRRILSLWGKKVIAISFPVKEHLLHDLGVSGDKVVLVSNGIDLSRFQPSTDSERQALRVRWGIEHDAPVVGIVARFSDVKGHQYLIEAMPEVLAGFPRTTCLLFGQGPLEGVLKEMVRQKGLEKKILFYPVVDQTAVVLPLLDICVMPSVQEGLGLSALEAGAMEIPTVASRVGGLPEVVRDGETGLLVPSRDPKALAAAMLTLLADLPRARLMGKKARVFVNEHYNAQRMADETRVVYGGAL